MTNTPRKHPAMKPKAKLPRTVDEYIASFPADVQARLEKIRAAIRKTAPKATEKISYRIAGFFLNGKALIYVAAFQKHVGMYPAPRGAAEFQDELADYGGGKGTVQFPHERPLPMGLIRRIVQYRIEQCPAPKATKSKRG
jgi:uncharacterized protein YdhG (YjbR/CyaY superfamily)